MIVRSVRGSGGHLRPFVLAGCAALAVGTLQGPVQAFPLVNEALDRGGEAGDVIVNLHAQLNMLGGLMLLLMGLSLTALASLGARWPERPVRLVTLWVPVGVATYYAAGVAFSAIEAHRVAAGTSFASAVAALEPWQALVLVPAATAVLVGFGAFSVAVWRMTARQRAEGRAALKATPRVYSGTIPKRVRRRSPAALAGYELPLGLMGFPGVGWLFAGFPLTASILLMAALRSPGRSSRSRSARSGGDRCAGSAGGWSWSGCRRWRWFHRHCSTGRRRGAALSCSANRRASADAGPARTAPASASRSGRSRCC